jgi:hypothetical protein
MHFGEATAKENFELHSYIVAGFEFTYLHVYFLFNSLLILAYRIDELNCAF